MAHLQTVGLLKVTASLRLQKIPFSAHFLLWYLVMNTGSWSSPTTLKLDLGAEEDRYREVIDNMAKDQQPIFHLDLCLLMPLQVSGCPGETMWEFII